MFPTGATPTFVTVKLPVASIGELPIKVVALGVVAVPIQQVAVEALRLAPNHEDVPLITHLFDAVVYLLVKPTASAAEKLVTSTLTVLEACAGLAKLLTL